MSDVTFRDFAGALMGGDDHRAAEVLALLLGLDAAMAEAATRHFRERMTSSPEFMPKAMGMRYAVERRDETELAALLRDCFALPEDVAQSATRTLLAR